MCLCTDDRNPLDIAEHGHIDHMIRSLIAMGCDTLAVYRAASLSAAEAFGLKDRGQIAPGKRRRYRGAARSGGVPRGAGHLRRAGWWMMRLLPRVTSLPRSRASRCARHMCSRPVSAMPGNAPDTPVIGIMEGKIITEHLRIDIAPDGGDKRPDPARDLARVAVIERHGQEWQYRHRFRARFRHGAGRDRRDRGA